jgi:hypothetical protein
MKTRVSFYSIAAFLTGLGCFGMITAHSAPPQIKAKAEATLARSNAIPQSVFTIPPTSKEGRDPFFPNSSRLPGGALPNKAASAHIEVALVLNGLSGTADHRLAMINGRTVAQGEEIEVPTASGRMRVRCIEIKGETVTVEVGGERRELRMRGE